MERRRQEVRECVFYVSWLTISRRYLNLFPPKPTTFAICSSSLEYGSLLSLGSRYSRSDSCSTLDLWSPLERRQRLLYLPILKIYYSLIPYTLRALAY